MTTEMGLGEPVIDPALERRFCDEDTETWMGAAIDIGTDAARDDETGRNSRAWIQEQLVRVETHQRHGRRHGWTAVAAMLARLPDDAVVHFEVCTVADKKRVEKVEARSYVAERLADLVLQYAFHESWTLAQLREVPVCAAWVDARLRRAEEALADMQAKDNPHPRALESKESDLAWWRDDTSSMADDYFTKKVWPKYSSGLGGCTFLEEWTLASFLGGATPELIDALGIPAMILYRALVHCTCAGQQLHYSYVSAIPRLLDRREDADRRRTEIAQYRELAEGRLIPPASVHEFLHYLDYQLLLMPLLEETDAGLYPLPPAFEDVAGIWQQDRSAANAIAVLRQAQRYFVDAVHWAEMSAAEQRCLEMYAWVLLSSAESTPSGPSFDLRQRIRIVVADIEQWRERNPKLLVVMVRVLKRLLYDEFRACDPKEAFETARRQIGYIQPLVAAWNLRGTINKGLGTIAARAVVLVFDNCNRAEYLRLLYIIMYALPERGLLRHMAEYACSPRLRQEDFPALYEYVQTSATVRASMSATAAQRRQDADADFDLAARLRQQWLDYCRSVWRTDDPDQNQRARKDETTGAPTPDELTRLVDTLCARRLRDDVAKGAPSWDRDGRRDALRWLLRVRHEDALRREADYPETTGSDFEDELEAEVELRVIQAMDAVQTIRDDMEQAARVIDEENLPPDDVRKALARLLDSLKRMAAWALHELPVVEREYVLCELRVYQRPLERHLTELTRIFDEQDEKLAKDYLDPQGSESGRLAHFGYDQGTRKSLVTRWMLKRYMLTEVAADRKVYQGLLKWWGGPALCVLPLVLAMLIYAGQHVWGWSHCWVAVPFLVVLGFNLVLLGHIVVTSVGARGISTASLLLPQLLGAALLGMMQAFAADESWSSGVLVNPILRLITFIAFLAMSFLFVRYVMLNNQQPRGLDDVPPDNADEAAGFWTRVKRRVKSQGQGRSGKLNRRALHLLFLGLWQAFTLVLLFSLLKGTVMSGPDRAALTLERLAQQDGIAGWVHWHLIPGMVELKCAAIHLRLFPLAVYSWTAEIFFISAIFERIMNRAEE